MKTIQELNDSKASNVAINLSLGKYRNKTPFPEKLAKAEEMLKGVKLPEVKNHRG